MSVRAFFRDSLARTPLLDGIFRRFIWSRVHFPEAEMRFFSGLPAGAIDVAVDVGAAKGCYSWIFGRTARVVYAFEPGTWHHRFLRRAAVFSNINVTQAAVGRSAGNAELYTPGDDRSAMHSATLSADNPVAGLEGVHVQSVRQVTLDEFLQPLLGPGSSVDVVKVDVEGYEGEVIAGSSQTLTSYYPLLICEIEARHNSRYREVFAYLRGLGYQCFVLRGLKVERFDAVDIEPFQTLEALDVRLSEDFDPTKNPYLNNFFFQHPKSKIKVSA